MAERPPADRIRTEMAISLYSKGLSPEEYAARYSHGFYCFSLGECRYEDPSLDAWIQRFSDILFQVNGAPTLDGLRMRHLTDEERQRIAEWALEDL
jgi:hypothetical protein